MTLAPTTEAGLVGLTAILADPQRSLVAVDYDGTLAPIVTDPSLAVPHPGAVNDLSQLTRYVGQVAIVTGRPARVAVRLAGLEAVTEAAGLVVLGHYGLERWDARTGELLTVEPSPGLAPARAELPQLLASLGLGGADIEDKGLSVAVHVRRLVDPDAALANLQSPVAALAERCGLVAEPGKRVIELRPPGMDKGQALHQLVEESGAGAVAFIGDDLGDVAAYDEVDRLRVGGLAGLLICSGSTEETALAARADIVVDGPAGVAALIAALVKRLGEAR